MKRGLLSILFSFCSLTLVHADPNQCPSQKFYSEDFGEYGEFITLPASSTVASAFAGTTKTIGLREAYTGRVCHGYVYCNYGRYWSVSGVNCNVVSNSCPSTTWTVYDLGGWEPVGGAAYLPNGYIGQTLTVRTRASNGKTCNVIARCSAGNWSPNFSQCP